MTTSVPAVADLFSVRGLSCVVTGASSGLGERFARLLATNGANVLAVARRADRLQRLAADFDNIVPHVADLIDTAQCPGVIAAALEQFGRVDVLVNNAGGGVSAPALDEDIADFRRAFDLNVTATFELARTAARNMIAQGSGSIVNVASILGMVASAPVPNAGYSSSKGAVIQLSRELAAQWARSGVRVNALAPGYFPSEATAEAIGNPSWLKWVQRNTPAGRVGRTDELDGALLFLASGASTFYTGQVLAVDGGWTAR